MTHIRLSFTLLFLVMWATCARGEETFSEVFKKNIENRKSCEEYSLIKMDESDKSIKKGILKDKNNISNYY